MTRYSGHLIVHHHLPFLFAVQRSKEVPDGQDVPLAFGDKIQARGSQQWVDMHDAARRPFDDPRIPAQTVSEPTRTSTGRRQYSMRYAMMTSLVTSSRCSTLNTRQR